MLPYKKVLAKSFEGFKDKRSYLNALIMSIPSFIYIIASTIILYNFNNLIVSIVNDFNKLIMNSSAVITSNVLNGYIQKIIDAIILNVDSLITTGIIGGVVILISACFNYVFYYIGYKVMRKESFDKEQFKKTFLGGIGLSLIYNVKIFLWSLLFIIPAIIKSYSYALCFFIKIENPQMKANDCIKQSITLMKGRKERLFIQNILFIGVVLLASICADMVFSIAVNIPYVGNILIESINVFLTSIFNVYWIMIIAVYYEEVKEDEKFLEEYPDLREKGITGRIKDAKPRIKIVYSPMNENYTRLKDPFKEEKEEEKDIYDANPFSKDKKEKSDDPFEE